MKAAFIEQRCNAVLRGRSWLSSDRNRERKYDVYGLGNALVDYLLFVDDSYLVERGITKGVMSLVEEPADERLGDDGATKVVKCSGGSAANTVVGLQVAGGHACFGGKVGEDSLGEFYRQDLRELGIDCHGGPAPARTGSCVSLITPEGERSMLTYLGASVDLTTDDIVESAVAESSYLYLEGYLWDSPAARAASIRAMELARRHNTRIAFSYSDPFLVNRFRDDFLQVTREYVDLLFCNGDEATAITGTEGAQAAALKLVEFSEQICITLGEQGSLVGSQGWVHPTPSLPVARVVDTTGAGDLYAAGVLRGLTLNLDLVGASLLGSRLAGAVIQHVGARLEREWLYPQARR
jgi:hypothetical protein